MTNSDDANYFKELRDNPLPEELDMIVEETTGKPSQRATQEGIAKVEQRLRYLEELKAKLESPQNPLRKTAPQPLDEQVRACETDLGKARELLAHLRSHYEARN